MAYVTFPRTGIPIGYVTVNGARLPVELHPEYLRAFGSMVDRVGGPTGTGTDDLLLSQFEDAGIEENKLALYRLTDDIGQAPPSAIPPAMPDNQDVLIEELRARVAELAKAVEALQQGMTA